MTKPDVCVACNAFLAECYAPVGDSSAPMCWLCAHHVIDHGVEPEHAPWAECECNRSQIYPMHVLQRQSAAGLIRYSGVEPAREHAPRRKTS